MEEKSPLLTGFTAVLRQPLIWAVPIVWDLLKLGLAFALAATGLGWGWVRWDFNVGPSAGFMNATLTPPPALPSAEQVGASFGATAPRNAGWEWLLAAAIPVVLMTVLDPLVRAGFLNQVNATLRGITPDLKVFFRGVRRFGREQLFLTLLWIPIAMGQASLAQSYPGLAGILAVLLLVVFYIAQFVIVTDDSWALQALLGAPFLLMTVLGQIMLPVMLSMVLAALLGGISHILGGFGWMLAIPAWGILGSAMTGVMMDALQFDISTKTEPGMPWACTRCKGQNSPAAGHCAVCGHSPAPASKPA